MKKTITSLSFLSLLLAFSFFITAQAFAEINTQRAPGTIDPTTITDYTITMDFEIQSACAGPCFGAKNPKNFYMWQINIENPSKTLFRPHSWKNGGGENHEDKDINALINIQPYTTYALRIEIKGDKASTYINDILIDADRINPRGGNYGFAKLGFRSGLPSEDALFDNIKVTTTVGGNEVVLFHEDFSSATDFMFINGTVIDGMFHPFVNELSWQKKSSATYTIWQDFEINAIAAGPLFGVEDHDNYYMWQVNILTDKKPENTVFFRPHIWRNGIATVLKEVEISDKIVIEKNVIYRLRIQINGDMASTYIDDILVDESFEPNGDNYGMGKLGYRASFNEPERNPEQAFYDNVKVTTNTGGVETILFSEDFSKSEFAFSAGEVVDGRLYFGYVSAGPGDYSWQQELTPTTDNSMLKTQHKFSVYPNPVQGSLNISNEAADYIITSLDGKKIQSGKGTAVDVTDFNTGIYLIRVGSSVSKFVKK